MSGNRLAGFSIYTVAAAALLCALILPPIAKAGPAPVIVNFAGNSICEAPSRFSGACFGAESVTGNFEFDPATDSVVGSWSFSFSVGLTLSSSQGDQAIVTQPSSNVENFFFTDGFNYIDLDYGSPIAPGALAQDGSLLLCGVGLQDCSTGRFVPGIVPEPPPLLLALGGLGFLGLAGFCRRYGHPERPGFSV